MRRPSPEEIEAFCERYEVTPQVAWRDYLQLRLAEASSRDEQLFNLCIWKGAFVMRFILQSSRASGDLDATVGTDRDAVDATRIRSKLKAACHDLDIDIPRETLDKRDDSLSFAPIKWTDPEIGTVYTSIDLSLRENLVLAPHRRRIDAILVPAFEILHIDPNEQAAEKMRCLAERTKVGDGHDVFLLWEARTQLDHELIRKVVPKKLTSGRNHTEEALKGLERRRELWEGQRGRELPLDAPSAEEMFTACKAAIDQWIP